MQANHASYRLARLTGAFKFIAIDFQCSILSGIIRRTSNYIYVLDAFHFQRVNKLYRKYKPVRITQKEHLLIWNSETTQNLNIYLHNYQTETAIFLATKHEKTIMACSYLNFSIQKIHQNSKNGGFCEELLSENDFEAVLINFCYCEYIIVPMLLRQFRSKDQHKDAAGVMPAH